MGLFTKRGEKSKRNEADMIFLRSFIVTIIGALVCIVSLSMSTWAWFVGSVKSDANSLVAASCEIDVHVTNVSSSPSTAASPQIIDDGYRYELLAGNTYSFKVVPYGTASTCYLRFRVGELELYLTDQLEVAVSKDASEGITFTITPESTMILDVLPRWGTAKELRTQRTFYKDRNYAISSTLVVSDLGALTGTNVPVTVNEETTQPVTDAVS